MNTKKTKTTIVQKIISNWRVLFSASDTDIVYYRVMMNLTIIIKIMHLQHFYWILFHLHWPFHISYLVKESV